MIGGRADESRWREGWLGDLAVFSTLNTVRYIIFQLSFCLSSFFLPDVRCLKGKRQRRRGRRHADAGVQG